MEVSVEWKTKDEGNCRHLLSHLWTCFQPRMGVLSWWRPPEERLEVQGHCPWSDLWRSPPMPAAVWPQCHLLPGSRSKSRYLGASGGYVQGLRSPACWRKGQGNIWKFEDPQKWKLFMARCLEGRRIDVEVIYMPQPYLLGVLRSQQSFATGWWWKKFYSDFQESQQFKPTNSTAKNLTPKIAPFPEFLIQLKSIARSQGRTKVHPQPILLLCSQHPDDKAGLTINLLKRLWLCHVLFLPTDGLSSSLLAIVITSYLISPPPTLFLKLFQKH